MQNVTIHIIFLETANFICNWIDMILTLIHQAAVTATQRHHCWFSLADFHIFPADSQISNNCFLPRFPCKIFPLASCELVLVSNCYLYMPYINGSPYSITERRVLELIPVPGSQPTGDVSHKPGGRLPLVSTRPAVTLATLKRAATNFTAW